MDPYKHKLIEMLEQIVEDQRERGRVLEEDHWRADEGLLWLINDKRVADAFNQIRKWYA